MLWEVPLLLRLQNDWTSDLLSRSKVIRFEQRSWDPKVLLWKYSLDAPSVEESASDIVSNEKGPQSKRVRLFFAVLNRKPPIKCPCASIERNNE